MKGDPVSEVQKQIDEMGSRAKGEVRSRRELEQAEARATLSLANIPSELLENMALFLRLVRTVLSEYDDDVRKTFDQLLADSIASASKVDQTKDEVAFHDAIDLIKGMDLDAATMLTRAFATYFHLANICEENYRVHALRSRERSVPVTEASDPINDITVAYRQLVDECGRGKAIALLNRLEFHPVFTAHPTDCLLYTSDAADD